MERYAAIEGSLSSECEEDSLRGLFADDLFHEIWGHRQEIYLIGHLVRGLHSRNVGIYKDGLYPLFPEGLESL